MSPYDDPHASAGEIADYLHTHPQPVTNLLPCPFCGETPDLQPGQNRGFYIVCENPACVISPETQRACDTEEQAATDWNTLPTHLPQAA